MTKCLTITEMIDFAIERGFDFSDLDFTLSYVQQQQDYDDISTRRYVYVINHGTNRIGVKDVDTRDLIMNDEFMKCTCKDNKNIAYQVRIASGGIAGSDIVRYITDYKEEVPMWLSKRIYLVALNDWDKAHKEMSDYIMKLKDGKIK